MKAKYVIQEHDAKKAGKHYDLRIQYAKKPALASFAIPKSRFPEENEKILAIRVPDHSLEWLTRTKPIEKGYGTGTYKIVQSGEAEIFKWNGYIIAFEIHGPVADGRFILIKLHGKNKDSWLLMRSKKDYSNEME